MASTSIGSLEIGGITFDEVDMESVRPVVQFDRSVKLSFATEYQEEMFNAIDKPDTFTFVFYPRPLRSKKKRIRKKWDKKYGQERVGWINGFTPSHMEDDRPTVEISFQMETK